MTKQNYIFPAEWHRQSCVQLTWPHADTDWQPYLDEIQETFVQIAKAVAQYERLIIAARNTDDVRSLLEESLTAEEMQRVSIYECDRRHLGPRPRLYHARRHGERRTLPPARLPLQRLG